MAGVSGTADTAMAVPHFFKKKKKRKKKKKKKKKKKQIEIVVCACTHRPIQTKCYVTNWCHHNDMTYY